MYNNLPTKSTFLYKIKNNILEIFIALMYFFRQSTKLLSNNLKQTSAGNLDLFYLLGFLYVVNKIKNKQTIKKYLFFVIPLTIYAILQLIFIKDVNILKLIINLIKICICIAVMLYVKENFQKINLLKTIKIFTIINLVFIIISIILGTNNFLWRSNDLFNEYSKTRLQLFFLEPSELGFHVAIILIVLLSIIITNKKDNINLKEIISCILVNSICLMLAQPMGAICILSIAFFIIILFEFIYNPSKKKAIIYISILLLFILACGLMVFFENPIANRVIDTINGRDSSNSFRIGVSFEVFKKSLMDYRFLGCGFGNVNTDAFMLKYSDLHLNSVIANSFIYFFVETGIFGILYVGVLIYLLFKSCIIKKSPLNWGLLSFVLIYQFVGSHFTSAIPWAIYGIILSDFCEKEKCEHK